MNLLEREVGDFPLSIGTSYALQGLFGTHPNQKPVPINISTIDVIWVNIKTLTRNLYAAMTASQTQTIDYNEAVDVLFTEAESIMTIVQQTRIKAKVIFYLASANAAVWKFPNALWKKPKTVKQLGYDIYEKQVATELYWRLKDVYPDSTIEFDEPEGKNGICVMLTHFPMELLWKDRFNRLLLLESHTGKVKPYNQWYTKLNGVREDMPMPFNRFTLQLFGDGVVMDSFKRNLRHEVIDLAKTNRWSGVTTLDLMYHTIQQNGSSDLRQLYTLLK